MGALRYTIHIVLGPTYCLGEPLPACIRWLGMLLFHMLQKSCVAPNMTQVQGGTKVGEPAHCIVCNAQGTVWQGVQSSSHKCCNANLLF